MAEEKTYHEEVEYYYQSSQKDYEIIWGAKEHGSFHYGFWEQGIKSHNEAINNTTEQVAKYGSLKPGLKVADLGCGIGGPAMYLAQKYGIDVDGVSITRKQIAQANRDAADRKLAKQAKFYAEDYSHTSLKSEQYDVVYGIESYCHAQDKLDVLAESGRLLKPGGKLVVLDFFWKGEVLDSARTDSLHTNSARTDSLHTNSVRNDSNLSLQAESRNYSFPSNSEEAKSSNLSLRAESRSDKLLSEKDKTAMKNWAKSWAVSDFAYEKEFEEKLKQAGFKNIEKQIVTKNVEPSIKRLFYIFIPSVAVDWVLRLVGKRKGKHENMWSAYYQYQCWKRGLWNYCIFTAEK